MAEAITVIELLGICVKIVRKAKELIETVKNARGASGTLLSQAERMRSVLEVLRSLDARSSDDQKSGSLQAFEEGGVVKAIKDSESFVEGISTGSMAQSNWVRKKKEAMAMSEKLQSQESEILVSSISISAESSVRTESDVRFIRERIIRHSEIVEPFDALSLRDDTATVTSAPPAYSQAGSNVDSSAINVPPQTRSPTDSQSSAGADQLAIENPKSLVPATSHHPPVWLGYVLTKGFSTTYISLREVVSDAAYMGDWERLDQALQAGSTRFNEPWINAPRSKAWEGRHGLSLWTPLHQAAFLFAPEEQIRKMVENGAFRTSKTRWTDPDELPYRDMTAAEIAREIGNTAAYQLLTPVVRHSIPSRTLLNLQDQFHQLIRADLRNDVMEYHLYSPELSVLTELETPEMFFPIQGPVPNSKGYLYRLDGRESLVACIGMDGRDSRHLYRVLETSWFRIEDALRFNA